MKTILFILLLISNLAFSQKKPFPKIAFGKGVTCIYIGSGAVTRHIDWTRFKQETELYHRSPFIAIGFDKCILPYASNAYWGLGVYVSSWVAKRNYFDAQANRKESVWTNTLFAIRATHHNAYFVREKLDMCSGFIIGTRIKYYHSKTFNEKDAIQNAKRTTLYPAFGISFTVRYYFYKNLGIYLDGALGYKTDFASVGLAYKIH
jgi:hypothetical protein